MTFFSLLLILFHYSLSPHLLTSSSRSLYPQQANSLTLLLRISYYSIIHHCFQSASLNCIHLCHILIRYFYIVLQRTLLFTVLLRHRLLSSPAVVLVPPSASRLCSRLFRNPKFNIQIWSSREINQKSHSLPIPFCILPHLCHPPWHTGVLQTLCSSPITSDSPPPSLQSLPPFIGTPSFLAPSLLVYRLPIQAHSPHHRRRTHHSPSVPTC